MSKLSEYQEEVKKYCIPNLRAVDKDGNIHPVVTTIQSTYEWGVEYARAERYRKLSIVELIIIVLMLLKMLI